MDGVASCSGVSYLSKRKRSDSSDGNSSLEYGKTWSYVLDLGFGDNSDVESISISSVEAQSTDFVRDTSDTSTKPSQSDMVEYEVVSFSEEERAHPFPSNDDSSSLPDDFMRPSLLFKLNSDRDSLVDDSSSLSSTSDSGDPELSRADFWTCIRCKEENNNPLFRYCEKCFKVRKNFFPPRPRGKKSHRKPRRRRQSRKDSENSAQQGGSSGLGSSILREDSDESRQPIFDRDEEIPPGLDESDYSGLCRTCFAHPKDGGYNHGSIVHVYNCYRCSKKILKQRGKCPICNCRVRQIARVVVS